MTISDPMVSHAQNGEDVVLDRAFPRDRAGFYIDAGAADPVNHSVTKHFYELGWRGINIEPTVHFFEELCRFRDEDINLNVGISNESGSRAFYEAPRDHLGESTFSLEEVKRQESSLSFEERKVDVMTLAEVCEKYVDNRPIDFLKIDVEGYERQVIEGADWARWRPRVLIIEATEPNSRVPNHHAWEALIRAAGYDFVLFDGLNRFYVRDDEEALRPLLSAPCNIFDKYIRKEVLDELQVRDSQLADIRDQNTEMAERLVAWENQIKEMNAEAATLRKDLTAARAALEETRRALKNSEKELSDYRIELGALQSALEASALELTLAQKRRVV